MNKHEFLDHLERLLKSLPRQERQKMLAYYAEMIDDRMEEGMREQEAVQDLGDAGMLAKQIVSAQPSKEKKLSNPMKVLIIVLIVLGSPLWACLLLALFALICTGILLILTGYIMIWLIPVLSAAIMVASLILCIISLIGSPFLMVSSFMTGLLQLGVGLIAAGLSTLLGLFTIYASCYFIKATMSFSHWLKEHLFYRLKEVHVWQS